MVVTERAKRRSPISTFAWLRKSKTNILECQIFDHSCFCYKKFQHILQRLCSVFGIIIFIRNTEFFHDCGNKFSNDFPDEMHSIWLDILVRVILLAFRDCLLSRKIQQILDIIHQFQVVEKNVGHPLRGSVEQVRKEVAVRFFVSVMIRRTVNGVRC